ncbi:hypothetical protein D3C80_1649110 [compost metagenome]
MSSAACWNIGIRFWLARNRQARMPRTAVTMPPGTLNGRSISGCFTRRTMTDRQTMAKAVAVPSDTRSPRIEIGRKAAAMAIRMPSTMVPIQGVRNFGCTLAKALGSRPSRAMV